MRKVRATIKDVARAAGVSPMTVSNVLNGRFQFVSARTRATVEHEILRLNYRIQNNARSLRIAHRRSVGMIIVDESPSFLADPFTAHQVAGLSNVLGQADYTLTVQGLRRTQFRKSVIIRNFEVDGFCVMLSGPAASRQEMIDVLIRVDQPVVLLQEAGALASGDVCVVRQDDEGGGRRVAEHLLARGAHDILVVLPGEEWPAMNRRYDGVRSAVAASAGRTSLAILRTVDESFESAQAALAGYLEGHPTPDAVIGGNDRLAIACMHLLTSRGVAVPGRVRVTGFNCFEPRLYAHPLLTTVRSPAYALGETAGELLLTRFAGKEFPAAELVLPVQFEPGQSS